MQMEGQGIRRSGRKRARGDNPGVSVRRELSFSNDDNSPNTRRSSRLEQSAISHAGSIHSSGETSILENTHITMRHSGEDLPKSNGRSRMESKLDLNKARRHGGSHIKDSPGEADMEQLGNNPLLGKMEFPKKGGKKKYDAKSINACASLLASLDKREYHRCVATDSMSITQRIVVPSSLPWMHKVTPVARNIPCDIDEMVEIYAADDGTFTPFENGPFGFGRFDTGQWRCMPANTRLSTSSDSWNAASRRSTDAGVVDLASVNLPIYPPLETGSDQSPIALDRRSKRVKTLQARKRELPRGELPLLLLEKSISTRRERLNQIRHSTSRLKISVRVNSSSSRTSIFSGLHMDELLAYGQPLQATLPPEVQNGSLFRVSKAREISKELGSYDLRYGLPPINSSGNNGSKTSCGRTRLIWTEKHHTDRPQDSVYLSSLTRKRLEIEAHKRPRDVKVVIRVGGEILGSASFECSELNARREKATTNGITESILHPQNNHPQPYENGSNYCRTTSEGSPCLANGSTLAVRQIEPILEELPDSDGTMKAICRSTGRLLFSSVHNFLNSAAKLSAKACTVCWASQASRGAAVAECVMCGLVCHPKCCRDLSKPEVDDASLRCWKCQFCRNQPVGSMMASKDGSNNVSPESKKSKRISKPPVWLKDSHVPDRLPAQRVESVPQACTPDLVKCALCPHTGGALSRIKVGEDAIWVHEICRIWLGTSHLEDSAPNPFAAFPTVTSCVLCGRDESEQQHPYENKRFLCSPASADRLIECADPNCQVRFHPMCALLSSQIRRDLAQNGLKVSSSSVIDSMERRPPTIYPSPSFGLKMSKADDKVRKDQQVNTIGILQRGGLPVGYCSIHNV